MKSLLVVLPVFLISVQGVTSQYLGETDERAAIPPHEDPGHNTHQEAIIYACLAVVVVLAVLCTLILWFVVERNKSDIRRLDKIIPEIAERMRKETITANGELMSGTLTASHEFETEFLTNEEVQLTSYRRQNEGETAAEATATPSEPTNGDVPRDRDEDHTETDREAVRTDAVNDDNKDDVRRHGQRQERSERHSNRHDERNRSGSPERRAHHNSYERRSHDRYSTPHDYAVVARRQNHARPPPPSYRHTYDGTYDNPVMSLQDEQDYRRQRRNGPVPTPAPKPAKRNVRPSSAYVASGSEYPEETPRPVSIIGIMGEEDGRRPTRHGHGRRYESILYESHV
nr:uncharacterized protein LOC129262930 [Lytechinus pictus]